MKKPLRSKIAREFPELAIGFGPLQDLLEDLRRDGDRAAAIEQFAQARYGCGTAARDEVDPNGGIDQNHRITFRSAAPCSRNRAGFHLGRRARANRGAFAPPRIRAMRGRPAPAWFSRAHDETPLSRVRHPERCSYASYTSSVYYKVYNGGTQKPSVDCSLKPESGSDSQCSDRNEIRRSAKINTPSRQDERRRSAQLDRHRMPHDAVRFESQCGRKP